MGQDSWSIPPQDHGQAGIDLKPLDWDQEALVTFRKEFYTEHPEVAMQTPEQCEQILQQHGATIEGQTNVKPIQRFEHAGFPPDLLEHLQSSGFTAPTSIQSIGWPVALAGHDMVGLAKTGSGKTLAFLLPALLHMKAQPPLRHGDGPIVLILAPTRELAIQIQMEAFQLSEITGSFSEAVLYGGVPKAGQVQSLRRGVELCIATPGRLLDLLQQNVTNLKRITYLVVDEADRMLDMGFEPQLRRIISQIRPDRQTLMWSATWPREIQHLARDICREQPIKVTIGSGEAQANKDIKQEVRVVPEIDKRRAFFDWLQGVCPPHGEQPRILIFMDSKRGADALCNELKQEQFGAAAIHGDRTQRERDSIMHSFRTGKTNILVATDVAQRGLDVKGIQYVVNYDLPKAIEDYVHRIGRTGRAGVQGHAITFFGFDFATPQRVQMARALAHVIRQAGQEPPPELVRIVERS